MNDRKLEKKVTRDVAKVKKDLGILVEDSTARLDSAKENVSRVTGKTKEDLASWVEASTSQLNNGFDKAAGSVKKTIDGTAATVKKDVGHRLSQYNARAQNIADNIPDGFSKKIARYPWVVMSFALGLGFLLGFFLKPVRQPLG